MTTSIRERALTSSLESYRARLEEFGAAMRSAPLPPSPELLDEIAGTAGELMLVLLSLQSAHPTEDAIRRAVSDSQQLREAVRSQMLRQEQITSAFDALMRDVKEVVRDEKRAA